MPSSLPLGATLDVESAGLPGPTFLHLHQNETLVRTAWERVLAPGPGVFYGLRYPGSPSPKSRRLAFQAGGRAWNVDPNRLFSRAGIVKDLAPASAPGAVVDRVAAFADEYLATVGLASSDGLFIALHNNTDGPNPAWLGYYEKRPAIFDVVRPAGSDRDYYVLALDRGDAERLADQRIAVAWQKAADPGAEGHLSEYAFRERAAGRALRYVCVEAQASSPATAAEQAGNDALLRAVREALFPEESAIV